MNDLKKGKPKSLNFNNQNHEEDIYIVEESNIVSTAASSTHNTA